MKGQPSFISLRLSMRKAETPLTWSAWGATPGDGRALGGRIMTSNEIKAARSKESQSNPTSALADSGGFLDDSVLAAIRQAAARLNPRQSARKPAVSETPSARPDPSISQPSAASEAPSASETPSASE